MRIDISYRFKVGAFECMAVQDGIFAHTDRPLLSLARASPRPLCEGFVSAGEARSRTLPGLLSKLADYWKT